MQCEGWRKYGVMAYGGDGNWQQCKSEAVMIIEVKQEKVEKLPACQRCRDDVEDNGIEILSTEWVAPNFYSLN